MPSLLSPLLAQFFVSRPLAVFSIETHLSAPDGPCCRTARRGPDPGRAPYQRARGCVLSAAGPLTMQIVTRSQHPRRARFHTLWRTLTEERWAVPASSLYVAANGWRNASPPGACHRRV
ncbi:hypothetical protein ACTMU2_41290 [Cupriavidus basilensis]